MTAIASVVRQMRLYPWPHQKSPPLERPHPALSLQARRRRGADVRSKGLRSCTPAYGGVSGGFLGSGVLQRDRLPGKRTFDGA